MRKPSVVLGAVCLTAGAVLAQGVGVLPLPAGATAGGWFFNLTGQPITGLVVEFDQPVSLVGVVEVGGQLENLGGSEGTAFQFAGSLLPNGWVELRWEPAAAQVALFQWLADGRPVGLPYFTTLPAFLKVMVQGLVALRERDPEGFLNLLEAFFAANPQLQQILAEAGIPPAMMIASLSAAPPEGILNLLTTLVEGFGITTLEEFQAALDLTPILEALGLAG